MRPLAIDILETFLPLTVGLLAYAGGRLSVRLPRRAFLGMVGVAVFVVVIAWPVHLFAERWTGPWVFRLGGDASPAIWAGLFLLGVVSVLPNRTLRTQFLVFVVSLVGIILLIQGGGRLVWRFGFPSLWENTADARGHLTQGTGVTCGPASAVMLLSHHRVTVSEGEMAYLCGTSVTGTNLYSLAHALSLELPGRNARVEWTTYGECVDRGEPFIAGVKLPHIRAHALFVKRLTPEHAVVVDPLEGWQKQVPRAEFEQWWQGQIVRFEPEH
jgi:hypothetical protein